VTRPHSLHSRWLASLALPLTVPWVRRHEERIRDQGEPLDERWKGVAAEIGVLDWDAVRYLVVDEVPLPAVGLVRVFARIARQEMMSIGGMTLGPSIYLTPEVLGNPEVLAHELVHVRQYERLGGVAPFLRRYFEEYFVYGYEDSPLELEANTRACMVMANRPTVDYRLPLPGTATATETGMATATETGMEACNIEAPPEDHTTEVAAAAPGTPLAAVSDPVRDPIENVVVSNRES